MDNAKFAKLCKDSGLYKGGFTATDADLIFSKVKAKGERKISFQEFQGALTHIAAKKVSSSTGGTRRFFSASTGRLA